MKGPFLLLLALAALAAWPVAAQNQERGARAQKQAMQPRDDRRELRRDRMERRNGERGRFSREERDKLRQDLLDANREMKGRR